MSPLLRLPFMAPMTSEERIAQPQRMADAEVERWVVKANEWLVTHEVDLMRRQR